MDMEIVLRVGESDSEEGSNWLQETTYDLQASSIGLMDIGRIKEGQAANRPRIELGFASFFVPGAHKIP